MQKNNLPFRIWCVLIGLIFAIELLPTRGWLYLMIATYDSSRWAHFLGYMVVVAIPFAAWRSRTNVLLSLIPAFVTYSLEYVQWSIYGPHVRFRNLSADLFGIAAGVLLGLNLRVMRSSGRPIHGVSVARDTAAP